MILPDLRAVFADAGVTDESVMLVHSSFRELGQFCSPDDVIDTLVDVTGVAVFPTFTYGWWNGDVDWTYDTPCDTGTLAETARRRVGAIRSRHPFYSVVALGDILEQLVAIERRDRTAFGGNVWPMLADPDGWICILGNLRYDRSFTFFHYVEETEGGVPYRHTKIFTGLVQGREESWTMPVRNDGIQTWVEPMGELLHNTDAMRRYQYRGVEVKLGRGADVYRVVAKYMKIVPELMYHKEKERA